MRLLLVDGDPQLAAPTARLLRHHFGAEVVIAPDGPSALREVRRDPHFDGAIVELDLPTPDGIAAFGGTAALDGTAVLDELAVLAPGISCGLWSASPALLSARAPHAAFRLSKGRSLGALLGTVERLLARRR